ncbi:PHD finger protein 20-like isoform X4 [Stegostoma tigrinum]|uniref:PHD finger protein 20-like isoform X4 n=1 Tax=Stegostoma tigrinum TaxID=3053191 RepID=UPI00202AC57C|nr:PHD finger protein 20-like isoform X4 [Stegostoma tigrinum]
MSKKPPSRRGITFEVGARLEARDRLKKWYTAHIEKIDYEEGKVLIHFKRWNHRYDEWFSWDSVYLRPLERPLLRKEGAKLDEPVVEFRPSEQVLACWSDCRFYPAKVISVNKDASYTVEFYDGVVQTVKKIHVKSLPKTSRDKNSASGRNKENGPGSARQRERLRERAPPSLGDERVKEIKAVEKKEEEAKPAPPEVEPKPSHDASAEQAEHLKSSPEALSQKSSPSSSEPGKPEEKRKRGRPPSVGLTGSHSKGAACQKDRKPLPSHQGGSGTGKRKSATDVPFQPKHTRLSKTSGPRQPASDQGQIQTRRRSLRLASGDSNSSSMGGQSEGAETRSKTKGQEKVEQAAGSEPSVQVQQPPSVKALCSSDTGSKASTPEAVASPKHQASEVAKLDSPAPTSELKGPPKETAPVVKRVPRSQNPNRYSREPLTSSTPNPENHLPPKALVIELDHNKFKCKIPECSKAFRKAKMLHYHMKYYHGMEKAEPDPSSPKRSMQTRGSCASEGESLMDSPKRRRTTSGSIRSRERSNEKKLRDFLKVKLKKKKKKKKKSKSEFSGSEENVDVSRDFPPKRSTFPSTRSSSSYKYPFSHKYTSLRSSDSGYYMEGLKFDDISDDDPTSDSSTDSLLWSEDEYNQDVDVTTNPDETGDGDDSQSEIVRCVCEVEEENEFMIQCEDCLCWQHGVCMGLLEDSVPETYTCYICRDPPDQRLSSRYWYDKEWLSSGHMHGLTFLKENYSHQNSGKIVSTHQLLGDVHKLIKVLHGLQLKIYILQNKDQPDLKLWCKPWRISSTAFEKLRERQSAPSEDSNSGASASTPCRAQNGTAEQQNRAPMIEESYITNEHCYQKPRAYYPAAEQRLVVETRNSALDEGIGRMRENGDETLAERFGRNFDDDSGKPDLEVRREQASSCKVRGSSGDTSPEAEAEKESRELKQGENEGSSDPQLQWQVNLLTHVESLQDEVCHRMDFIEKELDVLESWLDYSGELEPPDPLTRLPQLKHRMKQLLTDLGKVQQIASCCPV